ncbi:hypothetical protein P692DRAFT_20277533 [Suillus brevipes Sb2]|nr:hypothetical protein P692DRAFT_20277533 [Suillus brevipes Sb2]
MRENVLQELGNWTQNRTSTEGLYTYSMSSRGGRGGTICSEMKDCEWNSRLAVEAAITGTTTMNLLVVGTVAGLITAIRRSS